MSAVVKGTITMTGADTFTTSFIETNIQVDGKAGWQILDFVAYWSNGELVASADIDANLILATRNTVTTFNETDEICRVNWGIQNTAGIAIALPLEQIKRPVQFIDRITVQPQLFVNASTTGTALAGIFYYEVRYDIVKLSDLEVMRMLQGGA